MKTRIGFVSNSSSSSFLLGVKGKVSKVQIKDKVIAALKVPKDSMLYDVAESIAGLVAEAEKITKADLEEELGYGNKIFQKLLDEGFTLYRGDAGSDAEEPAERLLCGLELDFRDEDVVIIKEADY
jgi:hypothetical protein